MSGVGRPEARRRARAAGARALWLAVGLVIAPARLVAQGGEGMADAEMSPPGSLRAGASPVPAGLTHAPRALPSWSADSTRRRAAPWWAPVASAVVPGAGQFVMGQQRSVGYLVAEGYLLLQALGARRDGDRQREAYRALAATVARKRFAAQPAVGDWDYYESMEKYLESGLFDRVPGGAVDPETDVTTFNGARWLLARQIYWRDPQVAPAAGSAEYQRAIAFYEARAVRDAFRWSWRDAQLEQDLYRQTIAEANRSYQRAVTMTGMVWMNHLVSLVDAYVAVRVRRFGGAGVAGLSVGGVHARMVPAVSRTGTGQAWEWQVRLVPTPRPR